MKHIAYIATMRVYACNAESLKPGIGVNTGYTLVVMSLRYDNQIFAPTLDIQRREYGANRPR